MGRKKRVSHGVSRHSAGVGQSTVSNSVESGEETAFCAYCGRPFQRTIGSTRKFCTPSSERKKNWERKQALAGALACQFNRWKCRAADMLMVAKRCVEAAYEAVMKAMIRLGWLFFETDKVWRFAKGAS